MSKSKEEISAIRKKAANSRWINASEEDKQKQAQLMLKGRYAWQKKAKLLIALAERKSKKNKHVDIQQKESILNISNDNNTVA